MGAIRIKRIFMCLRIHTYKKIESLEANWRALEGGKEMTVFQSYEWNRQICNSIKNKVLFVVVISDDSDKAVLIAPLMFQKHKFKISKNVEKYGIYFLMSKYSDYLNFIYDEPNDNAINLIFDYIKSNYSGFPLFFYCLRQDTALYKNLKNRRNLQETEECCVSIDIHCDLEEYKKRLSKNTRQTLRTAKNRIDKSGINYKICICSRVRNEKLIKELLKVHFKRLRDIKLADKKGFFYIYTLIRFYIDEYSEIYHGIIKDSMMKMKNTWLLIIYIDQQVAGYLFGFKERNRVVRILQNCYEKKYAYYSPVFYGFYTCICNSIQSKSVDVFDMTRGEENYKYKLGGKEMYNSNFELISWNNANVESNK